LLKRIKRQFQNGGLRGVAIAVQSKVLHLCDRLKAHFIAMYVDCQKLEYGLNKEEERNPKVIVSLTSFPARFPSLHICIKSIMRQSYKPDKIVLYLDDTSKEQVGDNLLSLVSHGLEIVYVSENIRSHTKYFFAMQQYPKDIIIVIDDDMYYPKNMIEQLMQSYRKNPKAISARRVTKMVSDRRGKLASKSTFQPHCRSITEPSMQLFIVHCGGTLYPPLIEKCLSENVFDIDQIRDLCDSIADDAWLTFMALRASTPIVWVPSRGKNYGLISLSTSHIASISVGANEEGGHIDIVFEKLEEYYSFNPAEKFSLN